jgi:hypothetical protein
MLSIRTSNSWYVFTNFPLWLRRVDILAISDVTGFLISWEGLTEQSLRWLIVTVHAWLRFFIKWSHSLGRSFHRIVNFFMSSGGHRRSCFLVQTITCTDPVCFSLDGLRCWNYLSSRDSFLDIISCLLKEVLWVDPNLVLVRHLSRAKIETSHISSMEVDSDLRLSFFLLWSRCSESIDLILKSKFSLSGLFF